MISLDLWALMAYIGMGAATAFCADNFGRGDMSKTTFLLVVALWPALLVFAIVIGGLAHLTGRKL